MKEERIHQVHLLLPNNFNVCHIPTTMMAFLEKVCSVWDCLDLSRVDFRQWLCESPCSERERERWQMDYFISSMDSSYKEALVLWWPQEGKNWAGPTGCTFPGVSTHSPWTSTNTFHLAIPHCFTQACFSWRQMRVQFL